MSLKNVVTQMKNIFESSPVSIYVKDENLRYQYINSFGLSHLKISETDCLLLTDHEMHYAKCADDYVEHDLASLQGDIFHQIDYISSKDGEHFYALSHKVPLKDENQKRIGVLGYSHYFNNHQLMNTLCSSYFDDNCTLKITAHAQKMLGLKINEYGLTSREAACYYYLLNGCSAKVIAKKLSLSHRTVELYLASVRVKLHCSSKAELIEKGFHLGLINILPIKYYLPS